MPRPMYFPRQILLFWNIDREFNQLVCRNSRLRKKIWYESVPHALNVPRQEHVKCVEPS